VTLSRIPQTTRNKLGRNALLNLAGQTVPLLVAIVTVPALIRNLGAERFGILTLVWVFIGYYTLFDVGIGRALTKLLAQKLAIDEEHAIPSIFWTGILLMFLFGIAGACLFSAVSPWICQRFFKISAGLSVEALRVCYIIGATIPIVVIASGCLAFLEAHQRFDLINVVRIPMGISSFLGPLIATSFSTTLEPTVVVLAAVRLSGCLAYLLLCFRIMPELRRTFAFSKAIAKRLVCFGGWVTVSNIVSPVILTADRFLIGILVSMQVVAYYTTPYDMIMRLLIVPGALAAVLFPVFSGYSSDELDNVEDVFFRGIKYICGFLFPVILLIVAFAEEALQLWLGPEFAMSSSIVLQLLAIGLFANALAIVPFSLIQGAGRPDITAKIHLAELPFYAVLAYWLIKLYGIQGAALSWLVRVTVDAMLLFYIAESYVHIGRMIRRRLGAVSAVTITILGLAVLQHHLTIKLIIVPFVLYLYYHLLFSRKSVSQL
jgi:O-antigen/teichoic acid export membrane protein